MTKGPKMKILTACAISAGVLLSAASATTVAGAASPASSAKAPRQCFWPSNVNGFTAVDNRTVNVAVGVKDVYQLELFSPCPDVKWTETIGIESRGSSTICSGLDATLIAPSSIGPQRCAVRNIRKLTPEEVASLPTKQRP